MYMFIIIIILFILFKKNLNVPNSLKKLVQTVKVYWYWSQLLKFWYCENIAHDTNWA